MKNRYLLRFLLITFVFLSAGSLTRIFVTEAHTQSKSAVEKPNDRILPEERKVLQDLGMLSGDENEVDYRNSSQQGAYGGESARTKEQLNVLLRRKFYHQLTKPKWLNILGQETVREVFLKWNYFNQLDWHINRLHASVKEEASVTKAEIIDDIPQNEQLHNDTVDHQAILTSDEKIVKGDSSLIEKKIEKFIPKEERKIADISQDVNESERNLSQNIPEQTNAKRSEKPGNATGNLSFASSKGKLPWPVDKGNISERYGLRKNPEERGLRRENYGIDMLCPSGMNVRSVFDGTVILVSYQDPYEWIVTIKHGDYTTAYYHLNKIQVKLGDKVSTSSVLGSLSPAGAESFFHFEIWEGQDKVNPEYWLKKK